MSKKVYHQYRLSSGENRNTEVEPVFRDQTCRVRLLKRFADGAFGNRHLCDDSQPGTDSDGLFSIADKGGDYAKNVSRWMLDPDDVAAQITAAIFTKKREINLPRLMNAGTKLYQLFPAFVEKLAGRALMKK